ncbi:DHA2 family efflux MFS transporter permease subunit [Niveispirillum fermenti]|uniref:DHA2 family efflux MFS transporter permease subunit n=1 Tax=Niveispirillum fermenti TaxID=1233113 RepID=UPI003A8AA6C5
MENEPREPTTMPGRRELAGFAALGVGMFMAVLDVQIVAASLGPIRDGLGATSDEVSWVQTSYLIGEVLMIPLTGMLVRLMSSRYLFMVSAGGFTLASLGCAQATSMDAMIVWRAIQGFIGGAMVPMLFVAIFRLFPDGRRGAAMAAVTVLGTLAPTMGPAVGGWLTHQFSWHWLFLINLVPGVIITLVGWRAIAWDRPDWSQLRHLDVAGVGLLVITLGAGIYVLEEGTPKGWFDDDTIRYGTVTAIMGGLLLALRLRIARHPVVRLTPFRERLFAVGAGYSALTGVGVFGMIFLLVMFMDLVQGLDAMTIGLVMGLSGLTQLAMTPLMGWLTDRMDPRLMLGLSLVCFAAAGWINSGVTQDWTATDHVVPQLLRALGVTFIFPPVSLISFARVGPALLPDASGIFNLLRLLGGAVAIAVLNSLLLHRRDLHMAAGISAEREATAMAFADAFAGLTVLFTLALLVLICLRLPRLSAAADRPVSH